MIAELARIDDPRVAADTGEANHSECGVRTNLDDADVASELNPRENLILRVPEARRPVC